MLRTLPRVFSYLCLLILVGFGSIALLQAQSSSSQPRGLTGDVFCHKRKEGSGEVFT